MILILRIFRWHTSLFFFLRENCNFY